MNFCGKILMILIIWLFCFTGIYASNKYVSNIGSDSIGDGTLGNPYRSVNYATSIYRPNSVEAGDTLFLLGGIYNAAQNLNATSPGGIVGSPIVIRPYGNQSVVIDGTGLSLGNTDALMYLYKQYVVLEDVIVRNSSGRGISYYLADNITVRNCTVYNTQQRGIGGSGDNILIEKNTVYNACLKNVNEWYINNGSNGGWAAGIGPLGFPNDATYQGRSSNNIVVRNNTVYNTWGEGILLNNVDIGIVENNTVYNTYSALMYYDKCSNISINKNHLYFDNVSYNKDQGKSNERASNGIALANEDHYTGNAPYKPSENFTISNNLVQGTDKGVSYWHDGTSTSFYNSYRNIQIYHNNLLEIKRYVIRFDFVDTEHTATGQVFIKNNITSTLSPSTSVIIGNNVNDFEFSHNNWVSGIPSVGSHNASFSSNPLFINAVLGGSPQGFRLASNSSCKQAGTAVMINEDFWGTSRSFSSPSIGIEETASCPSTIIHNAVVNTGIYSAANNIYSNAEIKFGNVVEYKAEDCVKLNGDFDVKVGGVLDIVLDVCDF